MTWDGSWVSQHHGGSLMVRGMWSAVVSLNDRGYWKQSHQFLDKMFPWFWGRKSDKTDTKRGKVHRDVLNNSFHWEAANAAIWFMLRVTLGKVFVRHSPIRSAPALDNNDLVADFITLQAMPPAKVAHILSRGRAAWLNSTNFDPHYWLSCN